MMTQNLNIFILNLMNPQHKTLFSRRFFLYFSIFSAGHVKGRAVIDARVCASPGRDRENDEIKMTSTTNSSTSSTTTVASSEAGLSEQVRRSRKRLSSTITQNVECSLPSKVVCQGLSDKKQLYTAEVSINSVVC